MANGRLFSKDVEYRGYMDHCFKGITKEIFLLFKIKDWVTPWVAFLDSQGSFISGLCVCTQVSICFML